MARNTNVEEVLFKVGFRELETGGKKVDGYRAVMNLDSGSVLSVVGKSYELVTNEQALEYGHECYKKLFGAQDLLKFKVFNVVYPATKASCAIDVIQEGYEVNIGKQEVYLPYIRIGNSYNKTKVLSFDLGFCRRLCDNGVIFEKETVHWGWDHTKAAAAAARKVAFRMKKGRLQGLVERFKTYCLKLSEIEVAPDKALPLMARALELKFDLSKKGRNFEDRRRRFVQFRDLGSGLLDHYQRQMGDNAYAVFNAATDFASNPGGIHHRVNTYQRRAGRWAKAISEEAAASGFDLDRHLGPYLKIGSQ